MTTPQFSVTCSDDERVLRVVVEGELDMATEPELVDAVRKAVLDTSATRIVLDTAGLTFVDSSGLRALLMARDTATANDLPLTVVVVDGPVPRLFEAAGVTQWFTYE